MRETVGDEEGERRNLEKAGRGFVLYEMCTGTMRQGRCFVINLLLSLG